MFTAYKRSLDFKGRSNRTEYWLFILTYVIALVAAIVVDILLFNGLENMTSLGVTGPAYWLVILALLIPGLSVSIRRLHDTNRSGWWILISLIPLIGGLVYFVFSLLPGTQGPNRFGGQPGADNLETTFA